MEKAIILIQENIIVVLALVPVVTGVVEAIKRAGFPSRFAALLSLVIGAGLSIGLFSATDVPIEVSSVLGVILGLASSGLYSGGKAMRRADVAVFGGEA